MEECTLSLEDDLVQESQTADPLPKLDNTILVFVDIVHTCLELEFSAQRSWLYLLNPSVLHQLQLMISALLWTPQLMSCT